MAALHHEENLVWFEFLASFFDVVLMSSIGLVIVLA